MSEIKSLLVLGCGNMAQALVKGIYRQNPELRIFTYTPSHTRAIELAQVVSGTVVENLNEFPQADLVLIACKPQQFSDLADKLKAKLNKNSVVLSILAGIRSSVLKEKLQHSQIVRIMPNTPVLVNSGVNAFYFPSEDLNFSKHKIMQLFAACAKNFDFDDESKIDIVTPYSGSGPAYFFEIARIMIDDLVSKGFERNQATEIINHTILGAGKLLTESDESPEVLRNNVTSKKGVTFEALESFKENHLESIFQQALERALKRTNELANS